MAAGQTTRLLPGCLTFEARVMVSRPLHCVAALPFWSDTRQLPPQEGFPGVSSATGQNRVGAEVLYYLQRHTSLLFELTLVTVILNPWMDQCLKL